jgi:hypothetical protein
LIGAAITSTQDWATRIVAAVENELADISQLLVLLGGSFMGMSVAVGLFWAWKRWWLVRFRDMPLLLSFDPCLRISNGLRRPRAELGLLRSIAGEFLDPQGNCYYEVVTEGDVSDLISRPIREGERPHLLLKIPAREHLALADIVDFRLLRKFLSAGGGVTVLIIDVPKDGTEVRDLDAAVKATWLWVRRLLGRGARVMTLSRAIARTEEDAVLFFVHSYIPWLATLLNKRIFRREVPGSVESMNVSYLVFTLLARILEKLQIPHQPLFVIQWRERFFKWFDLQDFVRGPHSRIPLGGFVLGESLLAPNGQKIPTATRGPLDDMFHFTDDLSLITTRILAVRNGTFVLPDQYVDRLSRSLLGVSPSVRVASRMRGSSRRVRILVRANLSLEPEGHSQPSHSVALRVAFLEELSRVKRQLR